MGKLPMTIGVARIARERLRQRREEGYTMAHDREEHGDGSLAMAAACYAAPERIYVVRDFAHGRQYVDPFPSWGRGADKRFAYGENKRLSSNVPTDPSTYTEEERLDLLIKAGALIAAEIDRILADQRRAARKKGRP